MFKIFGYFFREITYCWRLFTGSKVVIIGILRALAPSANKEPERNLYIWFYYNVSFFRNSKFQMVWCFTGQRNNFLKKRILGERIFIKFSDIWPIIIASKMYALV